MPNVYARAAALSNVSGRIDYIANPDRQEHLICTYNSADELQFWVELSAHCQQSAAEAGHDKACEAREWHAALPNHYAEIYKDNEKQLAAELSLILKAITGTENIVALHWNKSKTNLHFHAICSENKEINEVTYGAVLTRNTYYDENGKRSTKKDCLDEAGNLKKGCMFYRKGERIQKIKRFGTKENLRDHTVTEAIKQALADKYNKDLNTLQYQVYKDDGMHIKTQKVGKDKPEKMRHNIENKNKIIIEYNTAVDDLLNKAGEVDKEQYDVEIGFLKEKRNEIKALRGTKTWLSAIKLRTQLIQKHIDELVKIMKSNSVKEIITDTIRNFEPEQAEVANTIRNGNDAEILQEALLELQDARQQLDVLNDSLAKCKFWESDKKRLLREQIVSESERCETAFRTAVDFGCSPFQDGVEMTGATVQLDGFLYFSEHVISKLQAKEKNSDKKSINNRIDDGNKRAKEKADKTKTIEFER